MPGTWYVLTGAPGAGNTVLPARTMPVGRYWWPDRSSIERRRHGGSAIRRPGRSGSCTSRPTWSAASSCSTCLHGRWPDGPTWWNRRSGTVRKELWRDRLRRGVRAVRQRNARGRRRQPHLTGNAAAAQTASRPVLLHGGPGSGLLARQCAEAWTRGIGPCSSTNADAGAARRDAADPATDMRFNTTEHLIADMERLREHLGIDRWLLNGGSWGSTLAIAYAERYPERVSEIVLSAITTSRRSEADWLLSRGGPILPRRVGGVPRRACPADERDGDLIAAYARLVESPEHRSAKRRRWPGRPGRTPCFRWNPARRHPFSDRATPDMVAMVRICAHYLLHGAWLEEGVLLREAGQLRGIPGVLIHGRLDLSCPLDTAWELARAWPGAELIAPSDSGHKGNGNQAPATARGHAPVRRHLTAPALTDCDPTTE